jgi:putative endonuclease
LLWNKAKTLKSASSTNKGQITEQFAERYLSARGLKLLDKNYHCRQGEIDLIMKDKNTYVFIEVKYRQSNYFGGAIAAVSANKQQKIKHCVTFYLQQAGLNEYNTPCRIDVVAVQGDINNPEVTWLANAF